MPVGERASRLGQHTAATERQRAAAGLIDARSHRLGEPPVELRDVTDHVELFPHDELRGSRGRRGAKIGDEIGNGEIGLVTDGGDHRHRALGDRARDTLVVERLQILDRSAPTRDDHDVESLDVTQIAQRPDNLEGGAFALDTDGRNHHAQIREAPLDDMEHVA